MYNTLRLLAFVAYVSACYYPKHKRAEEGIATFNYLGDFGPASWAQFAAECATGESQSPINLDATVAFGAPDNSVDIPELEDVEVINNGHTIEVGIPEGTVTATLGGKEFTLLQYHHHTPSEHRINGTHMPMEMHFVWASLEDPEQLAVLASFVDIQDGESDPLISDIAKLLPELKEVESTATAPSLNFASINERSKTEQVWTYRGSLTSPPCREVISWFIMDNSLPTSLSDYKLFRDTMGFNSRFVQDGVGKPNILALGQLALDQKPPVEVTPPASIFAAFFGGRSRGRW